MTKEAFAASSAGSACRGIGRGPFFTLPLAGLHQRIRDVEQSPDGYLYVITDEGRDSVLMKLEPVAG